MPKRLFIATVILWMLLPLSYVSAQGTAGQEAPAADTENTPASADEYKSGAYDSDHDGMVDTITSKVENDDLY